MSEKNINSRIQHKHDTEANWLKATNFIPKAGELIVYDTDENYNYPRIKIGNGQLNINNLNFVDSANFKIARINGVTTTINEDDTHIVNIDNYTPKAGDFLYIPDATGQYPVRNILGDGAYIKINNLNSIPIYYVGTYGLKMGITATWVDHTDIQALYQYDGNRYILLRYFEKEVLNAFAANFIQTYAVEAMGNVDLPSTLLDFYYAINDNFGLIEETFINFAEYVLASQPNWDASEDEFGHVLNRTHYDSMEYILPEQQLSFSSSDYSNVLEDYIPVEIGDTLAINFNGTEHICVVRDASEFVSENYIPAEYIAGAVGAGFSGGGDVFEQLEKNPFIIVFLSPLGCMELGSGVYLEVYGDYRQSDISFSIKKKVLKKLDSKFLPDEIPHTEKGSGKIILPTTPISSMDNGMCVYTEPHIDLTLGKEYVVAWGDINYYCSPVVVDFEGIPMIGLGNTLALNGEDTGEPFAIGVVSDTSFPIAMIIGCYDIENVPSTFSISESKEVIYKLDGKFLPEGTPYAEFNTILPRIYATTNMDGDGLTGYAHPGQISIDVGQTYLINWNGMEYECESSMIQPDSESNGVVVLGNISLMLGAPSTEEPFVILIPNQEDFISSEMGMVVVPLDGSTEFSLSIALKPKYHVIDSNLLPEGVPHTEHSRRVILQETQFEQDSEFGTYGIPELISILPGEKYIVNYNGIEYECLGITDAIDDSALPEQSVFLGDINKTKEFPFILVAIPPEAVENIGYGVIVETYDNSQSKITISISKPEEIIHKLDKKYLPDNIGGESTTDIDNKISSHNTSTSAHNDIRELITGLTTRLNTLANSDDTTLDQMSEIVAYIKNNKGLIDGITTSKVNVSDIINNLTTNITNKPLSAAQGVAIKGLIDALQSELDSHTGNTTIHITSTERANWNAKSNFSGNYNDLTNKPSIPDISGLATTNEVETKTSEILASAKEYTNTVKNDLLNGAGAAYDTLKELGELIDENVDAIKALETVAAGKANSEHTHSTATTTTDGFMSSNDKSKLNSIASGAEANVQSDWKAISGDAFILNKPSIRTGSGTGSIVEGNAITASGDYSHAEGNGTASGDYSHAEGNGTANGSYSHAEGRSTTASGAKSHAEGQSTIASGDYSHAEGYCTTASGYQSHAEGSSNNKLPDSITSTSTNEEIIEAWNTNKFTLAKGHISHAEGSNTLALGRASHAEGNNTTASSDNSHAEGNSTIASGANSHAEGSWTTASRSCSHAEGDGTAASGQGAHAEGYSTTANGSYSHAEGRQVTASGEGAHAEGMSTTASGNYSHAEGWGTIANGNQSHTEGNWTTASGLGAHAEGYYTSAASQYQHVQGKHNIEDAESTYAHIVGNGAATNARSNAHTLDWNGNAWFSGDVYVGSTSGTNKDEGSRKLIAAPTNVAAGTLLMYNGTDWVTLSKADLIAEIIAALPAAEGGQF